MNGRVFSSPVAGFSMTHMSGSKRAMISSALSTSASPSSIRRGRFVRARLYSVQTGLAQIMSKSARVPAPDVAQDRGLKFRHDVQGDDFPARRLEARPIDFLGMFNNHHQHDEARTGDGAAQAVSHARTNLFLIGDRKGR